MFEWKGSDGPPGSYCFSPTTEVACLVAVRQLHCVAWTVREVSGPRSMSRGRAGGSALFFFFFFLNHFCHVASGNACFFSGWQVFFFYGNETAVRRVVSFLMLPTTKSQSFAMDVRNGLLKMAFLGLHTHFLPPLLKNTHHLIVLTSFIYVCIYFKFVGMGCQTSAANGLGKQNAPCVRHLLWLLI